jgi:hypothetical protein
MHPLIGSAIVQQHIDDLHREAAQRRLTRVSRRRRQGRSKAKAFRLQRATAH